MTRHTTNAISIIWCKHWCQWCHMTKSHIAPHLIVYDLRLYLISVILTLRITVMPLTMKLASHDTNAGASGIVWPKNYVAPHFDHPDLSNAIVPLITPSVSCDTNASASGMTWPKKSCCTSVWMSWPKECNGAIDNVISITGHKYWCQWHHKTKKVMLHFILIILT